MLRPPDFLFFIATKIPPPMNSMITTTTPITMGVELLLSSSVWDGLAVGFAVGFSFSYVVVVSSFASAGFQTNRHR